MSPHTLLIVEDDCEMGATLCEGFEIDRYSVTLAQNGTEALALALTQSFDAIVLDVMLPGLSGFDVTRCLRENGNPPPIVMLTARDSVADIVHGFDLGVADYVTKPFSFLELSARVRSLIRRANPQCSFLAIGDLTLDPASFEVRRGGQRILLSRTEFLLLEILIRNASRVVSRRDLVQAAWGPSLSVDQNNLDVAISSLRSHIDKGFSHRLIQTVRGFGYRLVSGGTS